MINLTEKSLINLLLYVLTKHELFLTFKPLLQYVSLPQQQKAMVEFCFSFNSEFAKLPTLYELKNKFEFLGSYTLDDKLSVEYVQQEFFNFIRNESLKDFIISVSENIEHNTVNYDRVYGQLKELRNAIELTKIHAVDTVDLIRPVLQHIKEFDNESLIGSGILSYDKVMHGFARGEIVIIIAPSGGGKTSFLVNCAYGAVQQNLNVYYLSMELNEGRIAERLMCRAIKKSREEVKLNLEHWEVELKRIFKYITNPFRIIYKKPQTLSVYELESIFDTLPKNEQPDVVIVDYLDKLKPTSKDQRMSLGEITDQLRLLSEQRNFAVITATQANRASLSAPVITEEHISDSYKKVENADVVLSLCVNEKESKDGKARLVILKNREGRGKNLRGTIIPITYDRKRLFME